MKFYKSYIYSALMMLTAVLVLGACSNSKVYMTGDRADEHVLSDDRITEDENVSSCESDSVVAEEHTVSENISGETVSDNECTEDFYVYLTGAVSLPGVYTLPEGARLYEAVDKAGGFTEEADISACNLAEQISDGVQYYFPTYAETEAAGGTAAYIVKGSEAANTTAGGNADGRVNINKASKDELMTLPGVGETRANAIIAYRDQNGPFSSPEDIKNVSGIGDSTYENLKDYLTVG